jgi:hypothetical protein
VAVAARRCSWRKAGEQEEVTHARAPGGDGDAVPILGSGEEMAERAVDDEAELGRRR